jgi:hypothetical protein
VKRYAERKDSRKEMEEKLNTEGSGNGNLRR